MAAPRDAVFARLQDMHFFASCIEGVSGLVEREDRKYDAMFSTKVAYMNFSFKVTAELTEMTAPERITAKVEGTPMGLVGRLTATTATHLVDSGQGTTIRYEIDAALTGKLGSIGQPVMKSKAKEMEKQFAKNLSAAFAPAAAGGAP